MDHQKLFQTVGGHQTKASFNLHNHHHHHHRRRSNSNGNGNGNGTNTGPITPPSATSSSSIPHGLSTTNNWRQVSTAAVPSAPPSLSATDSFSCSSTPTTHPNNHYFSHSTLSSPVNFDSNASHSSISHSSISPHDSNGIFGAASFPANGTRNSYISIPNHNRNQDLNYNNFLLQATLSATSSSTTHQYATAVTNCYPDHSNFAAAVNNTDTTMHPPTGIVICDGDMDNASYYCFDRGNGQFTPLIPLDQLPVDILGLPARVASEENMIVLPEPRLAGDVADNQALAKFAELAVTIKPPTSPHNGGGSTDLIQSRIDDIVAHNPNRQNALVLARNPKNHAGGSGINNNSHNALVSTGGKREKIYCDKWIHDGTCAFTQQGCKFKHEMPGDRETQQSLGLFHGYPAWWKKKCAEENTPVDMINRPAHVSGGGYRNIVGRLTGITPSHTTTEGIHNNAESMASSALASNNWRQRTALGSPQSPPGELGTPNVTTPLSAGSNGSSGNGSTGASRTPWQPRSRAVGGNIQSRATVARYNMPRFAQPNFGPIAPPSQTATGFNNNITPPSRGSTHRITNAINNTGGGADNNTAVFPPVEQQQQHDNSGLPRGLRRTGGIPLRGGAQADESGNASSEDSNTNQSTDEMGNASGVKL